MMAPMYRSIALFLFNCCFSASLLAQTLGGAFTMHELLQRYTESYGGLRDANRLSSISIEGVQIQGGVEYNFSLHKKRPGSLRYQLEGEHASLTSVYNGEKGWLRVKQGGEVSIRELTGDQLEMLKKEARFESPLYRHLEKPATRIQLEGREMIGEVGTYILRVDEPDDLASLYYLEPRSSHVLRIDRLNEDGEVVFQTLYSSYKEVAGYPFAHEVENRIKGERVSLTKVESVSVNPGLLSFYFEKPVR